MASMPSAPPPADGLKGFVATLPPDVRQAIGQAVTASEWPLERVLQALIIAAAGATDLRTKP